MLIYELLFALSGLTTLVFAYLGWIKPESYVRAWFWAWGVLTARAGLMLVTAHAGPHPLWLGVGDAGLFVALTLFLYSAHVGNGAAPQRKLYGAVLVVGLICSLIVVFLPVPRYFVWGGTPSLLVLGFVALSYLWYGHRSWGQRLLAAGMLTWGAGAVVYFLVPAHAAAGEVTSLAGRVLASLCMVVTIYEQERRGVEENLLGLAVLNLTSTVTGPGRELNHILDDVLERLRTVLHVRQVAFWAGPPLLPDATRASRGFSAAFVSYFQAGGGRRLTELLPRYGGLVVTRDLRSSGRMGSLESEPGYREFRERLLADGVNGCTSLVLRSKDQIYGLLLVSHSRRRGFQPGELRFLLALAGQTGVALENLQLVKKSMRRSSEFELLTHIGTAISSALDGDALLRLIHAELQKLIDVRNFYVAFFDEERDEVRFELEVEDGVMQPKRSRRRSNALTEHVLLTGRPLLIARDVGNYSVQVGLARSGRNAKSWMGVPIVIYGKPVGVMAVQNYEAESAYTDDDLHILEIVAGQASVALENVRLFTEEQHNTRRLAFLNHIARIAISTLNADDMLGAVVQEIQKNFPYDYIGIGILNLQSKQLEFRAEAGTWGLPAGSPPRRLALGVGIAGTAARNGQLVQVDHIAPSSQQIPVCAEAQAVVAVPLVYAGQTLGVLNVESRRPQPFQKEQVLILQTLGDQLAVAFNTALLFQQMQQQAITDSLTGLKTRRYFMEALNAEWKRATRSARTFCVVIVDLDHFKQVNDQLGHLEGDLVLVRLARLLDQKVRASNTVARFGGDEFTVLLPETGAEQARILCGRLREWIDQDPMLRERRVTASFGLATFPEHGTTPEELLRAADFGMYDAKRAGGDNIGSTDDYTSPEQTKAYLQNLLADPREVDAGHFSAALPALFALTIALDSKDALGSEHSIRVSRYAALLALHLNLTEADQEEMRVAGRLHDIGKSAFSSELLVKNELSPKDWELLRGHPLSGAEMLAGLKGGEHVADMVGSHHEWYDGQGYPRGLKGDAIPLGGRIVALAEAYDAMTTVRPYRAARSREAAAQELRRLAGQQFDPLLVSVFLRALSAEVNVVREKA